ncbi:LAT2 domain-containing protein isoform X2 [Danio rerio]|uniref:LAT2 domain-containing protein isoform X2 n=1 Tax=Danio rerio TaxID=7955 RepID=A0A8M6YVB1_DANRE|nr:uncharacterized protein si:dkey-183i3.6 isoform X2 [Danio rerio]|eukprot:XP_017208503.1 uncharacterized protein si:dkey-183i3.6 isoform X2 [Danio rerio]
MIDEGMSGIQNQTGVLLAVISVACLACAVVICLCCRRRSNIQQADNDLYDQDGFEQSSTSDGKQPPTVIRSLQTESETPSTSRHSTTIRSMKNDMPWSYQNLPHAENGILEATYVDPIPNPLYANEDTDNLDTGTYENVFPTKEVQHDSDSYDYENSDFLANQSVEGKILVYFFCFS